MRKRLICVLLATVALLPHSGCCLLRGLGCCLHKYHCEVAKRTYCCDSCGEKYHTEWSADPPACCEPCNSCADYVGCRKNPWVGPKKGFPNCYPCNEGLPHSGCHDRTSDF